jgi:hypothetical protein
VNTASKTGVYERANWIGAAILAIVSLVGWPSRLQLPASAAEIIILVAIYGVEWWANPKEVKLKALVLALVIMIACQTNFVYRHITHHHYVSFLVLACAYAAQLPVYILGLALVRHTHHRAPGDAP